jgi:hypothetical protein
MPFLTFEADDGEIAGIVQVDDTFDIAEARAEAALFGFDLVVDKDVCAPDNIDVVVRSMVELRAYLRTVRDPSRE